MLEGGGICGPAGRCRDDGAAGHPVGGSDVGATACAGRDGDGDVLLQSGVSLGVIRGAVLPAAPQDPCPRAAEGAQSAAMVVAALTGVGVAVSGPGVPPAGVVREGGWSSPGLMDT